MSEKFIRHFYHPAGVGDWYVLEEEENYQFFGFVELIFSEWGYFTLEELTDAGVMEDESFNPTPISEIVGGLS